jgi:hypothetical protein
MAEALSQKAASRQSARERPTKVSLNVRACFKVAGACLSPCSEERSYETV